MATEKQSEIFVFDDLAPEDAGMIQALYSRSPASVVTHLDKVRDVGSGKFMASYYVGYGHQSIGDCGVTIVFMENYSMLAAKAIQDNPLYSGQEASTRYLDFAEQPLHDPYNHPASRAILDGWMTLYNTTMPKMIAALMADHPHDEAAHGSEKKWENALKARAFDVMRGFLPLGTTTLFSWTTNLRQARAKILQLKPHPLPENRALGAELFAALKEKYPNSFTGDELEEGGRFAERDAYWAADSERDNFVSVADLVAEEWLSAADLERVKAGEVLVDKNLMDAARLNKHEHASLAQRPKGAEVNRRLAAYGTYLVHCLIDFGSFRDLQRHRNGVCQVPLVEDVCGIHPWYLGQVETLLGAETYARFKAEADRLMEAIADLANHGVETTPLMSQYLYPMGTAIVAQMAYGFPQMVYVAELRSQATVHATLRPVALAMGYSVKEDVPSMALYLDESPDGWVAKRGEQTIEAKVA